MFRFLTLSKHFCTAVKKYGYRFDYGSFILPHPEKAYKGGEDALYASPNVLLIADGVGGWAESGVDPALYSKRLAKIIEELVEKDKMKYIQNPKDLVVEAVKLNKETGSTTVCLLTLHPNTGVLQTYYLGDSIFAILNRSKMGYRKAPEQQYSFNFPVQVGTNGEVPSNGVFHAFKPQDIQASEVIVVASDGLWDNLSDHMIYDIGTTEEYTLAKRAEELATLAQYFGTATDFESPFYLKAKEAGLEYPKQGKLDDNAVIVAKIIKEQL